MNGLNQEEMAGLMDEFVIDRLKENCYSVEQVSSLSLLTPNRLDLGFKLNYLDNRYTCRSFAEESYMSDILAQTVGTFVERGNADKKSFAAYIETFSKIYQSLSRKGFNANESLIPVSENGAVLNGAHRTACAIHKGLDVKVVKTELPEMVCDYRFYRKRGISSELIEAAVCKFIEYSGSTYLAFLWPSGKDKTTESINHFGSILYKKKISLTPLGAENLLREIYKNSDWLGNQLNSWHGLKKKLTECFPVFDDLVVIAYQADSLEDVQKTKKAIRKINGIGFSSIHITDNHEEAIELSRLLFNPNGLHFLNFSKPTKYNWRTKLQALTLKMQNLGIRNSQYAIDGGSILELYGLRPATDTDYLLETPYISKSSNVLEDCHNTELEHHEVELETLLYDTRYNFIYSELKFVSFSQVFRMKSNRSSQKDIRDVEVMKRLIFPEPTLKLSAKIRYRLYYFNLRQFIRFKSNVISLTKRLGIFHQCRSLYLLLSARMSELKNRSQQK